MLTPGRRSLIPRRWLCRAVGVALAAGGGAGCKASSKTGGGVGGSLTSRNTDPLMGGTRIPPQDLPIPSKDYGAREAKDPLLDGGQPASRGKKGDRAENGTTKRSDPTALPTGSRPTYRPGRVTTPAALAGVMEPDDTDLSIGTRPRDTPAGGGNGADRRAAGVQSDDYDLIVGRLRDYGVEWQTPERDRETGQYVFACTVPLTGGAEGRMRRYEGGGDTQAAAARQVLDQIRTDTVEK